MKKNILTPEMIKNLSINEMQELLNTMAKALAAKQGAPAKAKAVEKQPANVEKQPVKPEKQAPKAVRKDAKAKVGKLDCELISYSEKSLAVIGDTKPIKDTLKELGGRFNRFLKPDGPDSEAVPGWIFSIKKKEELEKIFG